MFKKIFGGATDKKQLQYLLKLILEIGSKEFRILNNKILGDSFNSKKVTVSIIAELEKSKKN